jgi:hypothetical protein
MARPTRVLVDALRRTAARLRGTHAAFRWTHMGACNCGHLAQTLTDRSKDEIHRLAIEKAGDWGEHAVEYCATSGYPIDHVLSEMLDAGLELADVEHLERLSDRRVLRTLPAGERQLDRRSRADAIRYMTAWADLLEGQLPLPAERSGVRRRPTAPATPVARDGDERAA